MKYRIFLLTVALSLLLCLSAAADTGITPVREYITKDTDALPDILNVGVPLQCGDLQIMLMGQPVLTKSNVGMVAELDMNYLTVRLAFTNNSEKTVGWLMPDSFLVQETWNHRIYGAYHLDPITSAKVAAGFKLPVFLTPIEPGKTLQTPLVFSVYPGAQSWILSFSPRTIGEEAPSAETVRFQLPAVITQ